MSLCLGLRYNIAGGPICEKLCICYYRIFQMTHLSSMLNFTIISVTTSYGVFVIGYVVLLGVISFFVCVKSFESSPWFRGLIRFHHSARHAHFVARL